MTEIRLLDRLDQLVNDAPKAVALWDATAGRGAPVPVTRAELRDRSRRLAHQLIELGAGVGDCVAVWLPNWSHAVAAQLAAAALGAHVIGVNTRYNVDEVAHILRTAKPKVLLVAHHFNRLDLAARLHDARSLVNTPSPAVLVVPAPDNDAEPDVAAYDLGAGAQALWRTGPCEPLGPLPAPGLLCAFTTSGSTGTAKLPAHVESAVVAHATAVARRLSLDAGHVVLGALPLSGVFGFNAALAGLLAGSSVLLEPVFDAPGVLEDMSTCGATHVAAADDLLGRLAAAWHEHPRDLSLQWVGIADFEGRSHEVAQWAEHEVGADVAGVYGSSELFALTAFWGSSEPPETRWSGGGEVVDPRIEVRTADPVTGETVGEGQPGELQFRGFNVVDLYLGQRDQSAEFTRDGWFRSGDLGELVGPGRFRYICRLGDVLRLRGFLVDPAEIELRLAAHPSVRIAKVVGFQPDGGGTRAAGFVTVEGPPPSEQELRDWCAATLAAYKVPSEIHVIDEMPTTSGTNGTKIRAAALRDLAQKGHERT